MNSNKYTLDRYEGDYAVFLKRPEESEQVHIHRSEITFSLSEGDIVHLIDNGEKYEIEVLQSEVVDKKVNVKNLIEELKNKNK